MDNTISIIIPTYNSEKTISETLSSILKQTYQFYEILIIDNNSIDNTVLIVNEFQKKTNTLKIYQEKDKGIYDAMNKGIGLSKGDWLYFMGSDDSFYSNEVLKDIFSNLDNCTNDIIYGNVVSNLFSGKYDGCFYETKLFEKNICHQSIFVKKTVFNEIGYFDVKYKSCADWEHNLRWFLNNKYSKKYLDLVVANYGEGGFSSNHIDYEFKKDKELKFIQYGNKSLPQKFKINLYKILSYNSFKNKKYITSGLFFIRYTTEKLISSFNK